MSRDLTPAVAYLRTSSPVNVGVDKDSDKRQRTAIGAFAKRAGFTIIGEYYDKAVSGSDRIDHRPGFREMLQRLAPNGAKTIIVESPDRFARDLAVQLAGHDMLKELGIAIIPKLASARKRKREREGRCEGRKPISQTRPEVVALARKLRRRKPKAGQLSLREVSVVLAAQGYLNERGKPYAAKSVASMLS
jgi:hypothetical protein